MQQFIEYYIDEHEPYKNVTVSRVPRKTVKKFSYQVQVYIKVTVKINEYRCLQPSPRAKTFQSVLL